MIKFVNKILLQIDRDEDSTNLENRKSIWNTKKNNKL